MKGLYTDKLQHLLGETINSMTPVHGGDVSKAYKVATSRQSYFIKINNSKNAYDMFFQEKKGLEIIEKTGAIKVPIVYRCEETPHFSVLIMQLIKSGEKTNQGQYRLGCKLADMHNHVAKDFGLLFNNYIGTLPQNNTTKSGWCDFYIEQRLLPQFELALRKGFLSKEEVPSYDKMQNFLQPYLSDVCASLLHGDLWAGNYLQQDNGEPVLIDPAIYYGHSEIDLAMTELFGGFADDFYRGYYDCRPRQSGYTVRKSVYQLYFLLVHLNMFGQGYKSAVRKIIRQYF